MPDKKVPYWWVQQLRVGLPISYEPIRWWITNIYPTESYRYIELLSHLFITTSRQFNSSGPTQQVTIIVLTINDDDQSLVFASHEVNLLTKTSLFVSHLKKMATGYFIIHVQLRIILSYVRGFEIVEMLFLFNVTVIIWLLYVLIWDLLPADGCLAMDGMKLHTSLQHRCVEWVFFKWNRWLHRS